MSLAATAASAAPGEAPGPPVVDLIPAEKAEWTLRNVFAGLSTLVRGRAYWYRDREVRIETVPDGASLALYYIRSNFQKRYERAEAPVRVLLPRRIYATTSDVLTVRVAAPGYLTVEERVRVFDAPERLRIQLQPLPNALVFLGHTHLAGRSTLTLRTREEPDVRVSRPSGSRGFTVSLTQTADQLPARPAISGGHLRAVSVAQVGEDLLLRVEPMDGDLEVRSRAHHDPVRSQHVLVLDIHPRDQRPPTSEDVRRELAALPDARPCGGAFGAALREAVDPGVLARGFRQGGTVAELYQREAMLALGRARRGRVETLDGEELRTGSDLELALALQSAASVRGYLELLGALARAQPDPAGFMRALIAPELSDRDFAPIYRAAELACSSRRS